MRCVHALSNSHTLFLSFQWKSSVVALGRRDQALAVATKDCIRQPRSLSLSTCWFFLWTAPDRRDEVGQQQDEGVEPTLQFVYEVAESLTEIHGSQVGWERGRREGTDRR